MREEIVIAKGRPLRIKNLLGKYRWIQLQVKDGDDRVLDGKYHPKLTYFYTGNNDYGSHTYSGFEHAVLIDMYGQSHHVSENTVCRQFPDDEQLLLMEEYGEVLLDYLKEPIIETIIEDLKFKCKV